jgi:hypothetical protein
VKSTAVYFTAVAVVTISALFSPLANRGDCRVTLCLVDHATSGVILGVVRIRSAESDGRVTTPSGLVSRGWGLPASTPISEWLVLPGPVTFELPAAKYKLEAISGLETERAAIELDLTGQTERDVRVPLHRFSNLRDTSWYAANTHLHLRDLKREEADRYLREIPAADRLDVLFISHLERADDDRQYISNEYPVGRLKMLETAGVRIANGEEHRHNFGPQGEGYGHVMLLGIKELVQPVSIGYGISKKHPDAPPIRAGIDTAHAQGGTAIWCHNNWGYEDVPNWLTGRVDAQNIFDGGSHDGYAESFYRYLNAGLRVPFSTGTDWFMYDFARAYARVDGELTPESWLKALKAGRTFITNGPLLELRVGTAEPGATIALGGPDQFAVRVSARGRLDFGWLELVQNGRVVESAPARAEGGHFEAALGSELRVTEPCWLAARVATTNKTEYGYPIFAHTSPVYVTMGDRLVEVAEDMRFLLGELEAARSAVAAKARFDTDAHREQVLGIYDAAIERMNSRLPK